MIDLHEKIVILLCLNSITIRYASITFQIGNSNK
ncbi:MAG: hypothetical protein ACJAZ2_001969 [Glaciecola sp.]|jgi:hypothetical protein